MKQEIATENVVKKKRGRKPKKTFEERYYFSNKEENAVNDYIETYKNCTELINEVKFIQTELDNCKKDSREYKMNLESITVLNITINELASKNNKIFNDILKPAFYKMIESIMRTYKLYVPNEETGDTINDTLANLITKIDKYNPQKNTKAYSYYGTMCKNYLKSKIISYQKTIIRNPSYDDEDNEFDLANTLKYSPSKDKDARMANEMVHKLILRINYMIENPKEFKLKECEIKIGQALKNLLDNWEFVISTDGSNKLNKQACLLFLREQTGLDTKRVRDGKKKYIKEFKIIRDNVIKMYSN